MTEAAVSDELLETDGSDPSNASLRSRMDDTTSAGAKPERGLSRKRLAYLATYNVLLALALSGSLVAAVAFGPYADSRDPSGSGSEPASDSMAVLLFATMATMFAGAGLGGTLCNLRGHFQKARDEAGKFPAELELPYYVRPLIGAVTGLLVFFVGSFFIASLSATAAGQGSLTMAWTTIEGRMPYIALALIAGYGSQEFMERLKAVANTLFSTGETGRGRVAEEPDR